MSNKYTKFKIHTHDVICNRRGFKATIRTSKNIMEVTCETCLAKVELEKSGTYPEKFYINTSDNKNKSRYKINE